MRYIVVFVVATALFASHIKRGEKIYNLFCQKKQLQAIKPLTTAAILRYCHNIDKDDAKDVLAYLHTKKANITLPTITPPKNARCPVCGMAISLYPNWSAMMIIGGKKIYFDGVKDMMKYYLDLASYHYDRKRVSQMVVKEFYHLQPIDAKKAFYVIGSDVRGPMGDEFIPFKSLKEAQTFMQDHHGKKILRFNEITLTK